MAHKINKFFITLCVGLTLAVLMSPVSAAGLSAAEQKRFDAMAGSMAEGVTDGLRGLLVEETKSEKSAAVRGFDQYRAEFNICVLNKIQTTLSVKEKRALMEYNRQLETRDDAAEPSFLRTFLGKTINDCTNSIKALSES